MNKTKKVIFSVLGFLVLIAGIFAGVFLVQKNQDIREKAAPATTLSFKPGEVTKNPGQTFEFIVNADTGENAVTAVDIELSFDPAVVQLTQMSGLPAISGFTTIRNGVIDNTAGKARYAATVLDPTAAVQGNLDIVTFTGTVLSTAVTGSSLITFSQMTTVAALNEGVDVAINRSPATLNVSSGTGTGETATPTAMATATATATSAAGIPTATPTVTPTATGGVGGAGVIPTPTPIRTATPTSIATVRPAATLPPDVPVTGVSLPLIGSLALGFGALIFTLFLAL